MAGHVAGREGPAAPPPRRRRRVAGPLLREGGKASLIGCAAESSARSAMALQGTLHVAHLPAMSCGAATWRPSWCATWQSPGRSLLERFLRQRTGRSHLAIVGRRNPAVCGAWKERREDGARAALWGAPPPKGAGEPEVRDDGLVVQQLVTLETNIDDMTAEVLAYVMEQLLKAGALDVWAIGAVMKKGRAGQILHVLCRVDQADTLLRLILRETTTLGVRVSGCERVSLQRVMESAHTPWGWVPVKAAYMDGALVTMHAEYDDCAALARRHNVPLKVVIDTAHKSFLESERTERKALGLP